MLGTVVFVYGGWPFLVGARAGGPRPRARDDAADLDGDHRRLRGLAWRPASGAFDLDFWWELAALVTIMLLGHWQEMKAIGQAQGALAALAALLPDDAERVDDDGAVRPRCRSPSCASATWCWCAPAAGCRPTDGSSTARAELDESMITGESRPVPRGVGDRVVAGTVATDSALRVRVDAVGEDTALAGIQRLVAQAQAVQRPGAGARRPVRRAAVLRRHRRRAGHVRRLVGAAATLDEAVVAHRHRAGDRLPARARAWPSRW